MVECLIKGCKHTTGRYDDGEWICSKHWRIVCPPRTRERKAYHAHFRRAKKLGFVPGEPWPDEIARPFFRFWNTLIERGQKRCAGDLDMTEINKMFGWSE